MTKRRNTLIFKTVVETAESEAVGRLLELIPDSEKLQPLIRSRFAETCYDPETRREYWIGGDDKYIICLMITGIGMDEVGKMRALFKESSRQALNLDAVLSHAANVTGGVVHLMN